MALVALLLASVVLDGSVGFAGADETTRAEFERNLATYRESVDALRREHAGRCVAIAGGKVLAPFESLDAAAAAADRAAPEAKHRFLFRSGEDDADIEYRWSNWYSEAGEPGNWCQLGQGWLFEHGVQFGADGRHWTLTRNGLTARWPMAGVSRGGLEIAPFDGGAGRIEDVVFSGVMGSRFTVTEAAVAALGLDRFGVPGVVRNRDSGEIVEGFRKVRCRVRIAEIAIDEPIVAIVVRGPSTVWDPNRWLERIREIRRYDGGKRIDDRAEVDALVAALRGSLEPVEPAVPWVEKNRVDFVIYERQRVEIALLGDRYSMRIPGMSGSRDYRVSSGFADALRKHGIENVTGEPNGAAAAEYERNLAAYRGAASILRGERAGSFVAIVDGRVLAPFESLDAAAAAADRERPDARHRFVYRAGIEDDDLDFKLAASIADVGDRAGSIHLGRGWLVERGIASSVEGGDFVLALDGRSAKWPSAGSPRARLEIAPFLGGPGRVADVDFGGAAGSRFIVNEDVVAALALDRFGVPGDVRRLGTGESGFRKVRCRVRIRELGVDEPVIAIVVRDPNAAWEPTRWIERVHHVMLRGGTFALGTRSEVDALVDALRESLEPIEPSLPWEETNRVDFVIDREHVIQIALRGERFSMRFSGVTGSRDYRLSPAFAAAIERAAKFGEPR